MARLVVIVFVVPVFGLARPAWGGPAPTLEAPAGADSPNGAPQGEPERPPALDAAYGVPPAGVQFDPSTTAEPGYVERGTTRTQDRSYSSTAQTIGPDGNPIGGLQLYDEDLAPRDPGYADELPEYHVVQPGDTLWDISGNYLADPYAWPRVWSWNEQVTNAHWIFPGDRIRLGDPSQPRARPETSSLKFSKTRLPPSAAGETYMLNQLAFVDEEQFETSMKVIGGGSAKVMMATLDTVYMSYDRQHPPVPGERLVVYAPAEEVKSIKDGKTLGYVVQIMGEVDVESLAREAAEGTLMTTYNPVERGYRVGPLRRVFRRVEQQQAQVSASGLIVATLTSSGPIPIKTRKSWRARENHVLVGEENFAVTNLGISSGVRVGNVLEVVRKGDEYTTKRVFHIPYEDGWPRRVVGTILVIEAQAGTSLGVVTYSTRELERGDHVELRGRSQAGQNARAGDTGARGQVEGEAEVETGSGKAKAKGSFKFGGD